MSDDIWYFVSKGERVGPVTAMALQQMRRGGALDGTTLCWQPAFGETWRPFAETGLDSTAPVSGMAPVAAGTARPLDNRLAWLLAVSPIILMAVFAGVEAAGFSSVAVERGVGIATAFGLVAADRNLLLQAGIPKPPAIGWALLSPVYLWKRATVLQQARTMFWTSIGVIILVIGVASAQVQSESGALLSCNDATDDVTRIFGTIDSMQKASITAKSLTGIKEVSSAKDTRSCTGDISGSDGKTYHASYSVTRRDDGKTYIRLSVQ